MYSITNDIFWWITTFEDMWAGAHDNHSGNTIVNIAKPSQGVAAVLRLDTTVVLGIGTVEVTMDDKE